MSHIRQQPLPNEKRMPEASPDEGPSVADQEIGDRQDSEVR